MAFRFRHFFVAGACNAEIAVLDTTRAEDSGTSAEAGSSSTPTRTDDAGSTRPDADTPQLPVEAGTVPGCANNAECTDTAGASGECYAGLCICAAGSWVQPSGRCSAMAPACDAPASCFPASDARDPASAIFGCLDLSPPRVPTSERAAESCVASGQGAICCVSAQECKGAEAIPDCYVRGSDQGYAPLCTNGWFTCLPGDSPEIRIE